MPAMIPALLILVLAAFPISLAITLFRKPKGKPPRVDQLRDGGDGDIPTWLSAAAASVAGTAESERVMTRRPVILAPGEGRAYPMGRIAAVFKADGAETLSRYSVSEWWLEPRTQGPGPHSHDEDGLFYVIEGVMSLRVDDAWHDCACGAFVLVPGGMVHDFENRGEVRAGVLSFSAPGGFEDEMPGISEWFLANPPKDAGG